MPSTPLSRSHSATRAEPIEPNSPSTHRRLSLSRTHHRRHASEQGDWLGHRRAIIACEDHRAATASGGPDIPTAIQTAPALPSASSPHRTRTPGGNRQRNWEPWLGIVESEAPDNGSRTTSAILSRSLSSTSAVDKTEVIGFERSQATVAVVPSPGPELLAQPLNAPSDRFGGQLGQ